MTEVVGEFPEVQGLMGKYYALAQGEDASVAAASEEHYKPLGPNDRVPTDPVSVAVALADKIDTLVAFWAINSIVLPRVTACASVTRQGRGGIGFFRTTFSLTARRSASRTSQSISSPAPFSTITRSRGRIRRTFNA